MSDEAFDRDFTLGELITARDADQLAAGVSTLLGAPVAVLDAAGAPMGSAAEPAGAHRAPLVVELEPVGHLAGTADPAALAGAAALVRWGLVSRARFRMVTDLHLEAVRADYAKLQAQNEALKASEAKYRTLSEELDAQVQEQVRILDERQRQLYQAERLAAIGQLAAGVAHEINNPLGFINSNLASARRYLGKLGELKAACDPAAWQRLDLDFVLEDFASLLDESVGGIDRIARIIRELKGFSNVDQPEEQMADMNAQIESLLAVIAGRTPAGVTVVRDFQPLPEIMCLPGHLGQALLNIIDNALQALDGHGTLTLRTRPLPDAVRIEIADDGPGIPEDVLPRIFEPFYTTRGVGAGTGLGLTVARDIVQVHAGRIWIDSEVGRGTTVVIELPT